MPSWTRCAGSAATAVSCSSPTARAADPRRWPRSAPPSWSTASSTSPRSSPCGRPRFFDYLSAPENATARGQSLNLGDPGALGAVRINPLSPDPAYVEELRQTHYHDTPVDRFDRWRSALSPDLPLAIPTTPVTLTAGRWGRIPRTFLRCAQDRALAPAAQDLMIAEADRAMPGEPFTVHTLPSSHSPFAARPRELAEALVR